MAFAHKKLLAAAAGAVLAGGPMVVFNLWINALVLREGQAELELTARYTIALAESRIAQTIAALDDLAERGVDSCRPGHIEAMRSAALAASAIKEIAVVGSEGQTLCSDRGLALLQRKIVGSQSIPFRENVFLERIHLGEPAESMVRIVRRAPAGNGLAALIPPDLLIARVSVLGNAPNTQGQLTSFDGGVLADLGQPGDLDEQMERLSSRSISERYGLQAFIAMPRALAAGSASGLQALGPATTGLIAIVILAFAFLLPRRARDNPIAELERAIQDGEFIPYYQPLVDITTGRLRGAEVLIRRRKRDGAIVTPTNFIPLAESTGLIVQMTRDLMSKTRDEIGEAFSTRPWLRACFNTAACHFEDQMIIDDLQKIFGASRMRLTQVMLEVTERQPLENLAGARRVIAAAQALGVRVAIDDVGAGHSGLSYMLKLGVDVIKIDKMFVDALGNDTNSMTIIETLVNLASNMRMDIVAEGVETFDQVVALKERGIRFAQGYVFAPPLPASSFLKLLEAMEPPHEEEEQPILQAGAARLTAA